jgi:hypothetical protein
MELKPDIARTVAVHHFTVRGEKTSWSRFSTTHCSSVHTDAMNVTSDISGFDLQKACSMRPRSGSGTPRSRTI